MMMFHLAGDGETNEYFGYSVSLSSDGNIAIVGAWQENTATPPPSTTQNGAGYIFTRSGSIWTQKAKLLANDRAIGDRLGTFVAMSGNGDLAILGAYQEDTSPYTNNGAAYVFTG